MRYLTAQEIKSETKVGKSVYLFDLFFLIIYMAVSLVLGNMVHPSLRAAFYLYSLAMAFFLTSRSYYNRKRRNYESIFIFFQRDSAVYLPVTGMKKASGEGKIRNEQDGKRKG